MRTDSDSQLLERWRQKDEAAFAELVRRYIHLVWGTACRVTGDADAAKDVAQTVFSDFARKAAGIRDPMLLPGWLHRAATLTARQNLRTQARRSEREQIAMQLHSHDDSVNAAAVEGLQPFLDEALAELDDADRQAVLLRHFEGRGFAEIGTALGISEDTAQKRVARAIGKLRDHFKSRGLAVSLGSVAAAAQLAGSTSAPAGLAAAIASSATAGLSLSIPSILNLATMKSILATSTAVILAIAALTQNKKLHALQAENAALSQQLSLMMPSPAMAAASPGQAGLDPTKTAEIFRLRAAIGDRIREGAGSRPTTMDPAQELAKTKASLEAAEAQEQYEKRRLARVECGKNLGLAARVYSTDRDGRLPKSFDDMKEELPIGGDKSLGGIRIDSFEFFPQPREISESDYELILFREKKAEPRPEGGAMRVYVMADGSVQQVSESNIEGFESERTAK